MAAPLLGVYVPLSAAYDPLLTCRPYAPAVTATVFCGGWATATGAVCMEAFRSSIALSTSNSVDPNRSPITLMACVIAFFIFVICSSCVTTSLLLGWGIVLIGPLHVRKTLAQEQRRLGNLTRRKETAARGIGQSARLSTARLYARRPWRARSSGITRVMKNPAASYGESQVEKARRRGSRIVQILNRDCRHPFRSPPLRCRRSIV